VTRLLYFAWVREMVGIGEEEIDLPPTLTTSSELAAWLAARGGGFTKAFANPAKLRCAVDQQMVAMDARFGDAPFGDALLSTPKEIAFFPPVTGG
jgi:sulfur-carrier protein